MNSRYAPIRQAINELQEAAKGIGMGESEFSGLRDSLDRLEASKDSNRRKQKIVNVIEDTMGMFFYYGRKEDEDLPPGAIERAVEDGVITVQEILKEFNDRIVQGLRDHID